ncbi:DEAD-domain-containing protein [Auriculariales sp. MPI-PUGE-AT-0066]|nr:DEAD-domain-containing protein [Auriculariales sp. MPI-PUGE-AT-0066]
MQLVSVRLAGHTCASIVALRSGSLFLGGIRAASGYSADPRRTGQFGRSSERTGQFDRSSERTGQYGRSSERTGQYGRSSERTGQYGRSSERTGQYGRSSERTGQYGRPGSRPSYSRPAPEEAAHEYEASSHLLTGAPEAEAFSGGEHLEGDVPYSQLQPKVSPETYTALTEKPMKLKTMSAVQSAVFGFLPNIASPGPSMQPDETLQAGRKDLLIQAKTGTGKTLAFLVPAIEQRIKTLGIIREQALADNAGVDNIELIATRAVRGYARDSVGTLIISPTRELATQIANEAIRAATHHPEFEVRLFVGGVSKSFQLRDWMRGSPDIVVATPGRLLDLLHTDPNVAAKVKKANLLVLDEADTLLDMGFREDIERIRRFLPEAPERQTFLCSATVSPAIRQVTRDFLRPDHEFISTVSGDESPVHAHVQQHHTVLPSATDQVPHILRLIAHDQMTNAGKSKIVIFLNTTKNTQLSATILREMARTNLPANRTGVYELHSKRHQDSRTNTSNAFRGDQTGASVLVTSDVSARGVDYPGVTRVIQVGIPSTPDVYVHRVGRTGRAGTSGRGDLVLLPWEGGFIGAQLRHIPMIPLGLDELKNEVSQLAQEFDAEPTKFHTPSPTPRDRRVTRSISFPPSIAARIDSIETAVDTLKGRLDENAINETFAAMLGFYIPKAVDIRCDKQTVVEGCKTWAVEACGLSQAPYVSPQFLAKMGYSEGSPQRSGRNSRRWLPTQRLWFKHERVPA